MIRRARASDADLLIVDPTREWRVERDWLYSRHKHSPFIGWQMKGWITRVLRRGQTIACDGAVVGPADGEWLRMT